MKVLFTCNPHSSCTPSIPAFSHVNRHLSFPAMTQQRFYSRTSGDGDVYVPESPLRESNTVWQPGQHLPLSLLRSRPANSPASSFDVCSMFQSVQHTMEDCFKEVKGKLLLLENRISELEERQAQSQQQQFPSTPTSSGESDQARKRRSPCELQVSSLQ